MMARRASVALAAVAAAALLLPVTAQAQTKPETGYRKKAKKSFFRVNREVKKVMNIPHLGIAR